MNILKKDKRLWDDDTLDKTLLFELLENHDEELFALLLSDKDTKKKYFVKAGESYVFKYEDFRFFIERHNLDGSFTKYAKNIIGLSNNGKYLTESTDYVLEWPFKDTILVGGMSSEEQEDTYIKRELVKNPGKIDKKTATLISPEKTEVSFLEEPRKRKEIFFNNIIAEEEIDQLLKKKAFKNFKRYRANGAEEVIEIKRDQDGTIKENLLIKGNNLIALSSLEEQFAEKVKLIYIDPPYNTGNDSFPYNDSFNKSTWLTFMKNRLEIAKKFLRDDGVIFVSIDHNEVNNLNLLMEQIFGIKQKIGLISIVNNKKGRSDDKFIATSNEFLVVFAKDIEKANLNNLPLSEKEKKKAYSKKDEYGYYRELDLRKTGFGWERSARPKMYYPIYYDLESNTFVQDDKANSTVAIFPTDSKGREGRWRWGIEKFNQENERLIVRKVNDKYKVYEIQRVTNEKGKKAKTVWDDPKYDTAKGKKRLEELFNDDQIEFDFPKPPELLKDIITMSTKEDDIVMDFFAGSCTTADSLISFGTEIKDRTYVLIEQMDYLNEIGVPRVQKVLESINSKDSFIYFELAEYNQEAKNKIDACKTHKDLKKLFTDLSEYYFLNYNVSVKDFSDEILEKDKDFEDYPLSKQKKLFKALLDNNQLYISFDEQDDPRFKLSEEDRKLTEIFYG